MRPILRALAVFLIVVVIGAAHEKPELDAGPSTWAEICGGPEAECGWDRARGDLVAPTAIGWTGPGPMERQ